MKTYLNLVLIIASSLLIISCDDFLDETPKGIVIPSTVEDYDKMMNDPSPHGVNLYLDYADPDNGVKMAYLGSSGGANARAFGWVDFVVNEEQNDGNWDSFYRNIYIDNEIINNIDNAEASNESLRHVVKADALADRAACYFFLVNMYAKHYDPATASSDLGVPILLENDLLQDQPRATVQEVYDQIFKDLNEALPMVRTTAVKTKHRTSKEGINGFFAKIHLFMGNYEEAKNYANSSFTDHNNLIDFNAFGAINSSDTSPRVIPRDFQDNEQFVWFKGPTFFDYGVDFYYGQELIALYDKATDMRWRYYAIDSDFGTPLPAGEYMQNLDVRSKDHDRCVLVSSPETLLIRAEGRARTGDKDGAIADLNILRLVRYETGTPLLDPSNFTAHQALQEVLDERRRELALTSLNWYDLRRYHVEGRAVSTYTREYDDGTGSVTVTLEPGSNRYVFAIPPKLFFFSDNMEQNPR